MMKEGVAMRKGQAMFITEALGDFVLSSSRRRVKAREIMSHVIHGLGNTVSRFRIEVLLNTSGKMSKEV